MLVTFIQVIFVQHRRANFIQQCFSILSCPLPLPVINVDTNHLSYAENLVCFGIQILCEFIRWLHELLLLLNICNIDLGGEGGLYVFEISLVVCKTKTFKKVD